jgi:effector-binding domain-containing protein
MVLRVKSNRKEASALRSGHCLKNQRLGMIRSFLICFCMVLVSMTAARAQQPTLPPPGSLTIPPAAPNPLAPQPPAAPPAEGQQPPGTAVPQDQVRSPEVGGPTDLVLEPKPVIVLRGQSTWDDGFDSLTEAFGKLAAEATRLKLITQGRPKAAFLSTDDFGFKYEAMIELSAEPASPPTNVGKDFAISKSPSGKTLKFTHFGAYDDIDTTYEAITAYLDEKGIKARNIFIEEYVNDPKSSEDATLEMNIFVLVE